MAIIPLRAYNREIEGLIDNGQLDEAVAHCRHILATFPKHIATYRLLGKAHLEQQGISDATDIFLRVLSAIPDDFIANVGMSIIREDENNLDASIWHMELAYEAQPSNVAIQDELRRLYGRRDGVQPPKVRLTRGALARMYAKGGLFDQAIAELRAAITEDPNRPDLQLLLAQMFFQISQRLEAVETCVNILKKLPYCLAANQILAVSLPEAEQSDVRKNYRQIAITMDPYFGFANMEAISSDQVPENAVNIERLDWKSGLQISEALPQPNWATSLGIELEKPAEEKLPDWIEEAGASTTAEPDEKAQAGVSPFIWDTQEVKNIITDESKPEGEIPEWMKDAGWKPASGETTPEPSVIQEEPPSGEAPQAEDLEKADMPEWLRGIAPEGVLKEGAQASQPEEKDVSLPWLEKQQPGPTDSIIQWLQDKKPESPVTPAVSEAPPQEGADEEMPAWLKDLDVPLPSSIDGGKLIEDIQVTPPKTPAFIVEEPVIPAVQNIAESGTGSSTETGESIEITESIQPPVESPLESEGSEPTEVHAMLAEELPDWLKELAEGVPESAISEFSEDELKSVIPTTEEEAVLEIPMESEGVPAIEIPVSSEEELPVETPTIFEEVAAEVAPSIAEEVPAAELPVPSEEVSIEEPITIPETLEEELPVTIDEIPLVENAITGEEQILVQQPVEEESELFTEVPALEEAETSLDWVKLEAETPLEEAIPELEPQAEEAPAIPAVEIPDWIKGLGETPEIETVAEEPEAVTSLESVIPPAEELPSWLLELEEPEGVKEATESPTEVLEWKEGELPEWLKEIAETELSEEVEVSIGLAAEEIPPAPVDQVSEWTVEVENIPEVGKEEQVELQPEEPAWISEVESLVEPVSAEEVPPELEPAAITEELSTQVTEPLAGTLLEEPVVPVTETPEVELAVLEEARNAIGQGLPTQAAEIYTRLIQQNHYLDEVVKDLQDALYRFPVDVNLWVSLGDAYFRTDELQEALNAYTKAEELVR